MPDTSSPPTRRVQLHPALAWPVVAVLLLFIAGWLYAFAGASEFSPWWLVVSVPVFGWTGAALARTRWAENDFGVAHERAGVRFAWLAGLVGGAWLTWSGFAGPGRALGLLLLGALPLWAWFVILMWRAPKQAEVTQQRYEDGKVITRDRTWRTILDRAGSDDLVIVGTNETRAGLQLVLEPSPDARRTPTYDDFAGRARAISTEAALAYRRTGSPLPPGALRPEPGSDDAEFLLNVTIRDVFDGVTEYVPAATPGDICLPLDIGEFEDGSRILISMTGHMKIVGASGSGKSVVANNIIGRVTECRNAVMWVGATDKLMPLVWPWLRSFYAGQSSRPVLDYVAGKSVDSVLRMLRDAYRLACERNDRLTDQATHTPTEREPLVVVAVEEVSHAVEFRDVIETHDGQECTVSDLLKLIAQAGRSAQVWLILLSQYGINVALGDRASELIRNLTQRICLRTMEAHDGYRTLPGLPASVNTTAIPLYTMLVQPNIEIARAVPGKSPLLESTMRIDPIACRQAEWRPAGVEPESNLGADYARRWDAARLPELARAVERAGLSWRTPGEPPTRPAPTDDDQVPAQPAGGDDVDDTDTGAEDSAAVDTWNDADDAALRELIESETGREPPAGPSACEAPSVDMGGSRKPQPFKLDTGAHLDRLRQLAADAANRPPGADEPGEGAPVPEPLRSVVAYLDQREADRGDVDPDGWVLTADLAEGIEWKGTPQTLGIKLSTFGLRSNNLPRAFDQQQRKGYRVRDIAEAMHRARFEMP
jgi:hypothetical protein